MSILRLVSLVICPDDDDIEIVLSHNSVRK